MENRFNQSNNRQNEQHVFSQRIIDLMLEEQRLLTERKAMLDSCQAFLQSEGVAIVKLITWAGLVATSPCMSAKECIEGVSKARQQMLEEGKSLHPDDLKALDQFIQKAKSCKSRVEFTKIYYPFYQSLERKLLPQQRLEKELKEVLKIHQENLVYYATKLATHDLAHDQSEETESSEYLISLSGTR